MSENTDQAPAKKKSLARRIASIVAGVLIALAVIILIICMNLGTTVKVVGEKLVTQLTKGETTIGDASISLLSGRVTLSDIQIKNPTVNAAGETISFTNDSFFKLGKIDIDLNVPSLLKDTIEVREILIDSPQITYEKTPLNDSNLHAILANVEAAAGPDDKTQDDAKPEPEPKQDSEADQAAGKKVIITHLLITNATVNLSSCGLTAPLTISKVELNDLGKEEEGVSMATAICETFTKLFTAIFDGVKQFGVAVLDITKSAGKQLKEAGSQLKDAGKQLIDGLKNPFGK
ncbi:MAG: AsmA family protein [Oligosphaeraceae bacterium]